MTGAGGATPGSKRLKVAILAAGFAAAVAIYVKARPAENPLGYDPAESKQYVHDMELYGGKANRLGGEVTEWFMGLWHGRNLAFTVAALTVLTVLAIRFVERFPPEEGDDAGPERPGPRRVD